MRRKAFFTAAAAILLAGCYHVTVVTGVPAGNTVVDKPWQMSFVYGLVPPPELNVSAECAQGVATVETERTFVNGLVGVLSGNLVTPLHARITCR